MGRNRKTITDYLAEQEPEDDHGQQQDQELEQQWLEEEEDHADLQ
jgi:hypothetical protein